MSKIIGIFDDDISYGNHLSGYINQKENGGFTSVSFSSIEYLRKFQERRLIQVLLLAESLALEEQGRMPADKIYILTEDETKVSHGEWECIFKYQSVERILAMITAKDLKKDRTYLSRDNEPFIIGVFSPVGRCLKTSFAFTISQILSRNEKVLYVSLEEYGVFPGLTTDQEGLSELFYHSRKGELSLESLMPFIVTKGMYDYIVPASCPEDLMDFSAEETAKLIQDVGRLGGYRSMVLDLGNGGRNPVPLFQICRKIYMPIKEDVLSRMKIEAFENYLRKMFREDILAKIEHLKLPYHHDFYQGENYLDTLVWGELGDYTRELLRGGA